MQKRRTFQEKQNWILDRLESEWQFTLRTTVTGHMAPSISSGDEEAENAWHEEFGGRRVYYTMGAHSSPDFARTLRKMWRNGLLYRATIGNQGARAGGYAQKTYSVHYSLKRHYHKAKELREAAKAAP